MSGAAPATVNTGPHKSWVERALGLITEVHAGEGATALILTLEVFLLLVAYYLIKPVREALILVRPDGAEVKSYMSGAIAVALVFAVPAYASATQRFARDKLVTGVTLFFASNLLIFYVVSTVEAARGVLALVFFVWMGVFSMMVVAQFWSYANDLYTQEQGKRLFALLGLGASIGAAAGSGIAAWLIRLFGAYPMLIATALLLGVCAGLTQLVEQRERGRPRSAPANTPSAAASTEPSAGGSGAFALIFSQRYLLLIAAFSLVFTLVNTNGEYMLSRLVKAEAERLAASGELQGDKGTFIGAFYGSFFFWVNSAAVLLQTFAVSRLVKYGGMKVAFFVMPVIALADALGVALLPSLMIIQIGKTAENATDYSINNTVRNMLWLPTSREVKYKAKQAADTFFVRMGDVSSAALVFVGSTLAWSVSTFAALDVGLVLVWLLLAAGIVREHTRLSGE